MESIGRGLQNAGLEAPDARLLDEAVQQRRPSLQEVKDFLVLGPETRFRAETMDICRFHVRFQLVETSTQLSYARNPVGKLWTSSSSDVK